MSDERFGPRRVRRALLLVAGATATVLLIPFAGSTATPNTGTVSEQTPSVGWSGPPAAVATASSTCGGASNPACDNFRLTIQPPSFTFQVDVKLQPFAAGDWDLEVYGPNGGLVGHSGNAPGHLEVVTLVNPPAGAYTVSGVPFAPAPGVASYTASATILPRDTSSTQPPAGSERGTYANYAAPAPLGQDSGEPSIGADWKTGNTMYQAGLEALRVTWDDCASPGTPTWTDVSFPNASVASLDPIGFCDHDTGRWFSSQLSGTTSLAAFTDDDGANWTPSEGGPLNGGVDHQTIGGGPFAGALKRAPNGVLYPNAVYYCSQDIVAALCARSDTGGLTFNPAVPIYTSECEGLHGHVKVAGDGTVYVPNKNCANRQGVVVSEDNGVTWSVRTVPSSLAGAWDPSAAIATDGTVYLGYDDGDGRARIAVSHDKGRTWVNVRDVGVPFGVVQSAFPRVVAGDPDRAAFAFLGTRESSPGAFGDDPSWPGEWHLYVATTYDGGDTWTTVDATPNDPVQRGTICGGGFNGCDNGTRNLLDFMGADLDKDGRVLVGYPDGCIGDCVTGGPGSFTAIATIARQVSGKRLFAASDTLAAPAAPAVAVKASAGPPPANVVSWQEPDDHGSAITSYKVYRRTSASSPRALIATVPGSGREYVDSQLTAGTSYLYAVTAVNAVGEGIACRDVAPGIDESAPKGTPCEEPGVTVLSDAAGDSTGGDPAKDVLSLSVAEPRAIGLGNIEFVLRVASLAGVPANSTWPVLFKSPDGTDRWVRMKTDALGAVSFGYGTGTNVTAAGTAALPSSGYSVDGTIRVVVPRDAVGATVGGKLTEFLVRIRTELAGGAALTPDNMPDSLARTGQYTVFGNENCTVAQPNLTLAAGDLASVNEKAKAGWTVTLVARVRNAGTADAANVRVRLTIDGVQVGAVQSIGRIVAGSFGRASVTWNAPREAAGSHAFAASADPDNAIAESSESDNTASTTITLKRSGA
jgi:hypothetical protein